MGAHVIRVHLKFLKLRNILHAQQYGGCLDMHVFFFYELGQLSFCWLGLLCAKVKLIRIEGILSGKLGMPGCCRCRGDGNVLFISVVNSKVTTCTFLTGFHEKSVVECFGEICPKLPKLD